MNCEDGEFEHWDHRKCIRFSRKLVNILVKREMAALATGCNMQAIQQIWPNGDKKTLHRRTYILCIKQVMVDLAHIMEEYFPGDGVLVIHDQGSWNDVALAGYNLIVNESDWPYGQLFAGLVSKSSKDSSAVGLQAADMIAHEVFKGIKAKTVSKNGELRAVMKEFLIGKCHCALDGSTQSSRSSLPGYEGFGKVSAS